MEKEGRRRGWADSELPREQTPAAPRQERTSPPQRGDRPPQNASGQPQQGARNAQGTRNAQSARNAQGTRNAQGAKKRRKKKKRLRAAGSAHLRVKLLTMLAVVAAIVLGFTIFFKVQRIEVRGNTYYTAQEVAAATGVENGDNLLTAGKETIAAHIRAELPYISEVQVKRSLPNALVITVSEYDVSYGIADSTGAWWLINREGRVLEAADAKTVKSAHITVEGLVIAPPAAGDDMTPAGAEQNEELLGKKNTLLQILQQMELRPFAKQIVSVDVTASFDVSLWYGDRYQIRLGIAERLEEKFDFLEVVLEKLEDQHLEGVIDLTFSEDQNVRFQPFKYN